MIYPSNQNPPIWSIDPGIIAYNCKKAGMPHPVLAMPMWERAGDHVFDYSGNFHHGTNHGADRAVEGLNFVSANNDYVVSDFALLGEPITIAVRYTTTTIIDNKTLCSVANKDVADQQHRLLLKVNGYLSASTYDGTESSATESYNSADGRWHSAAAVFETGSLRKIYRDGIHKDTDTVTHTVTGINRTAVGVTADSTPYGFFNGSISYALIFDVALSAAQIKFLSDNPYFMYEIPEELYGYVAGVPSGWTGEIIGITNPTEILGRATSGISEVMGIS